jgi:chemotaxis-related protein WspB
MLLLLFNVGEVVHAVDAKSVVEVLPLVDIKKRNGAPRGVVGTFNYRGAFVPVVDLSDLLLGRPVSARLSTRIILARYSFAGMNRLVGIVAENATETLRCEPSDLASPGIVTEAAPYLGSIAKGPSGFVQTVDVDKLAGAIMPGLLLSA